MEKKIYDGSTAFPTPAGFEHSGMSLRDWFAGQALAGFGASEGFQMYENQTLARQAYEIADAMLAERFSQGTE